MSLFVERPRTLLDEIGAVTVLVVEPDRVASVWPTCSTKNATDRRGGDDMEGEFSRPSSAHQLARRARRRADINSSQRSVLSVLRVSTLVRRRCPGRSVAHRRARAFVSTVRRGVVLTSNAAAVERMAEQLRSEGLEVTTDPPRCSRFV